MTDDDLIAERLRPGARDSSDRAAGVSVTRPPRILLLGMMGREPFAGVAMQVLHYIEGFARLGYEVWYVEDTDTWPYDPEQETITDDPGYTLRYISRLMNWVGRPDEWVYRSGVDGRVFNVSEPRYRRLLQESDALINLTGATVLREEHMRVPVRIYLETDPVGPQIEVATGNQFTTELLAAHTHHFTYGENFGAPDCGVPIERFDYVPTRQPVVLEWWRSRGTYPGSIHVRTRPRIPYTTVGNWDQSSRDIDWNGDTYAWSKHSEFLKFIDLPRRTTVSLELALAVNDVDTLARLRAHGWRVVDAVGLSLDIHDYRDYIISSRGEFTVAKDQNIRLRSGWFSDRSASYLAAGRPVITQDTGFGNVLPTGHGLFAFRTTEDILSAFESIESDYVGHSRAAREIAEAYFRAETVVERLVDRAGLPSVAARSERRRATQRSMSP